MQELDDRAPAAMKSKALRKADGIIERHSVKCRISKGEGDRCNCKPSYVAWVYLPRDKKKRAATFSGDGALKRAKDWRADMLPQARRGTIRAASATTVRDAAEKMIEGMKAGTVKNRSGRAYKPSVIRGYEHDLDEYVLPEIGAYRLHDIGRSEAQQLVDLLGSKGLSASKVKNACMPARVLYRRAVRSHEITVNPFADLDLPAADGRRRDRAVKPEEFLLDLLPALGEDDQALFATAYLSGLRRGELRALRWEDVELPKGENRGVIDVHRSWDDYEGLIEPKSVAGRRRVPFGAILRRELTAHQMRTGRRAGLVFGRSADAPFTPTWAPKRALKAWEAANEKRAEDELDPLAAITLHECRHAYASWLSDAGFMKDDRRALLGHGDEDVTDRYTHPVEGQEKENAARMDVYLARRLKQPTQRASSEPAG